MGFRWYGKDTERTLPFLLDFKLCNRGTSKSIHNAMQLRDEMYETDIRIFDYHYHISAGNYHHRYKQTVFFVQSQLLGLPEMYLRPERFFHRISAYLNLNEDIDFISFPVFSKQYRLTGADEDFIRYTMHDDVLHFFSFNKHWWFEGLNYYFILYKSNELVAPKEIEQFCQMGLKLIGMLRSDFP